MGGPIPYYPREEGRNSAQNGEKEITLKWMRHRGFSTRGIQTGLFAACLDVFVPKVFHLFTFHTGRSNSLLPQREEGRKEQGLKMGKRESPRSKWDTGISDLGAFKLDHFQPIKLILFKKMFRLFYLASHNKPFNITPERGRARKWEKGTPQKLTTPRGIRPCGIPTHTFMAY